MAIRFHVTTKLTAVLFPIKVRRIDKLQLDNTQPHAYFIIMMTKTKGATYKSQQMAIPNPTTTSKNAVSPV
jgi:hypothetical protein